MFCCWVFLMKSLNRHPVRIIPMKSTGKINKPSNFASEWLETSAKWPEGNGSKIHFTAVRSQS